MKSESLFQDLCSGQGRTAEHRSSRLLGAEYHGVPPARTAVRRRTRRFPAERVTSGSQGGAPNHPAPGSRVKQNTACSTTRLSQDAPRGSPAGRRPLGKPLSSGRQRVDAPRREGPPCDVPPRRRCRAYETLAACPVASRRQRQILRVAGTAGKYNLRCHANRPPDAEPRRLRPPPGATWRTRGRGHLLSRLGGAHRRQARTC